MSLSNSYLLMQGIMLLLGIGFIPLLYNKLFWTKRNAYDRTQDSFFPEALYVFLAALARSSHG